jgi:hypothetical protein
VESAEVQQAGHPLKFQTFHPEAAMCELQVTLNNVGHRVAIGLIERLISAPKITGGSRGFVYRWQLYQAQAEALVKECGEQTRP